MSNLNPKKASGCDNVPPKLIKLGAKELCCHVTKLVNMSIVSSKFPSMYKYANVSPIYKKDDAMLKKSYRPVSVLPCMSKIFEKVMIDQLNIYFENVFNDFVSGFRKGHSCDTVLLRFIENVKSVLDDGKMMGALLMDLSKAFDCLPHKLLISKFHAYGVDINSCTLLASYFRDRYQRVKIGCHSSQWLGIGKGAPQGSYMGPFAYNVQTNDLLYLIMNVCQIFNYADDNTICSSASHIDDIKVNIEQQAMICNAWFANNYMKVNADKFQAIIFETRNVTNVCFKIDGQDIEAQDEVKLLGITFDKQLKFDTHVGNICRKAGRQLSVLKRLSNVLDKEGKLLVYNTFIFSNFNYCAIVWHCSTMLSAKKLEKIQERALRYVFNDHETSYEQLLLMSDKSLLYVNRLRSMLQFVYKILHHNVPLYLNNMFSQDVVIHNTRCHMKVIQPTFNTMLHGYNSICYQGSKLWNAIPNNIKQCQSYKSFKYELSKWNGMKCECMNCMKCKLYHI